MKCNLCEGVAEYNYTLRCGSDIDICRECAVLLYGKAIAYQGNSRLQQIADLMFAIRLSKQNSCEICQNGPQDYQYNFKNRNVIDSLKICEKCKDILYDEEVEYRSFVKRKWEIKRRWLLLVGGYSLLL